VGGIRIDGVRGQNDTRYGDYGDYGTLLGNWGTGELGNSHALLSVCHGVVIAAVQHQTPIGCGDFVVVVGQHALHRHAAPEPADFGAVPRTPCRQTGR
jgi:hypothetical protein